MPKKLINHYEHSDKLACTGNQRFPMLHSQQRRRCNAEKTD